MRLDGRGLHTRQWFRYPFVKRIMAYESLSETDYNLDPEKHFRPNLYVDIKNYLDKKVDLLKQYESEISDFLIGSLQRPHRCPHACVSRVG